MNDLFPETLPTEIAGRLSMQPHLVFTGIDIRQDAVGRYCLNDLHKAAGGANKHAPFRWSRNQRTKDLIAEFQTPKMESETTKPGAKNAPAPVAVESTGTPSTYVIKPLVYAYGMWVSPTFHKLVCEVFDAVVRQTFEEQAQIEAAFRRHKPHWFEILEHNELPRGEIIKITGHTSPATITANRRRMRECGLMPDDTIPDSIDGITEAQILRIMRSMSPKGIRLKMELLQQFNAMEAELGVHHDMFTMERAP
jgi:hypothetical protein